jgi:hypothetical protein
MKIRQENEEKSLTIDYLRGYEEYFNLTFLKIVFTGFESELTGVDCKFTGIAREFAIITCKFACMGGKFTGEG